MPLVDRKTTNDIIAAVAKSQAKEKPKFKFLGGMGAPVTKY
jgi:hypothetical protein